MPSFSITISHALFDYINGLITAAQAGPEVVALAQTLNPVFGTSGLDRLKGTTGADVFFGGNSQDFFFGGKGNDLIYTGAGTDYVRAGAGEDTLLGEDGDDRLWGDNENDLIYGGIGNDRVYGGAQNDTLYGGDGADIGIGGSGNVSLFGGAGNDAMRGGVGDDRLWGDDGRDKLWGDQGDDRISGGAGDDKLFGGDGADIIAGGTGSDLIYGGAGNDQLISGADANQLFGGDGDDVFSAFGVGSVAYGGNGNDLLNASAENVSLYGGSGEDVFIFDGVDNAYASMSGGNVATVDQVTVNTGSSVEIDNFGQNDILTMSGTALTDVEVAFDGTLVSQQETIGTATQVGNDVVITALGSVVQINDRNLFDLIESASFDDLIGTTGDDTLNGVQGAQIVSGLDGNDDIYGAAGNTLFGGNGSDTFYIGSPQNTGAPVVIADFEVGVDTLNLYGLDTSTIFADGRDLYEYDSYSFEIAGYSYNSENDTLQIGTFSGSGFNPSVILNGISATDIRDIFQGEHPTTGSGAQSVIVFNTQHPNAPSVMTVTDYTPATRLEFYTESALSDFDDAGLPTRQDDARGNSDLVVSVSLFDQDFGFYDLDQAIINVEVVGDDTIVSLRSQLIVDGGGTERYIDIDGGGSQFVLEDYTGPVGALSYDFSLTYL